MNKMQESLVKMGRQPMKSEPLIDLIYRLKASCVASELDIMEESGLSPAEYNGIAAVDTNEKISGSAVSQKMNLSPSRASRVVDKMVKNGYLLREIDAGDRRKCNISLAEKGMKVKTRIQQLKRKCEKRIEDELSEKEIDSFSDTLKKLINII